MGLKLLVIVLLGKRLNSLSVFYGVTNSMTILLALQFALSLSQKLMVKLKKASIH